jgi:hypothetical protein
MLAAWTIDMTAVSSMSQFKLCDRLTRSGHCYSKAHQGVNRLFYSQVMEKCRFREVIYRRAALITLLPIK